MKVLGKAAWNLKPEERVVLEWFKDPVLFVQQALGANPEKWQGEFLTAVRDNSRVAVKSGHGVGKSTSLAWLIIWYLLTRYPTVIIATANTEAQLTDVLLREVEKWVRKLPEGMKDLIVLKADRIELRDDPKQCYAALRTARRENPEAFQGRHEQNLLLIADEASGIDDVIFEVGKGSMSTPGAKTIMTGNPTRPQGYFYNAFHSNRQFWHCITVPCWESSQVSKQYIEECKEEYGEDSNMYRVRVMGEFPIEGDDILIPLHLVESSINRDVDVIPNTEVIWGLDVARFGDDRTALAKRQGNVLLEPIQWWAGKDLMQTVNAVHFEYKQAQKKPDQIFVDAIGIGAGVADRLNELGLPVTSINVAESPAFGDKFMRLRDEMWWNAREWFKRLDVKIPDDKRFVGEITLPTYGFSQGGKIKVESKDEMKKRTAKSTSSLGKSPDLADAFCLTFSPGVLISKKRKAIKYPSLGLA